MHNIPDWLLWILANFKLVAQTIVVLLIAGFICAVWACMRKKDGRNDGN